MSCGCNTSGNSTHSCGTKINGCDSVNTCGNSYKLSVFDWLSNIPQASGNHSDMVEVRFKNDRKSFYKNENNLPLRAGSIVTVESNPGHDVGIVSLTGELVKIQIKKKRFREDQALKIYRLANQRDVDVWQEAQKKENDTKIQARKIASALRLEMKITDVEYQGDGNKATFYYTADNRIDFRQLIKDMAQAFHTKIDMKQIGFRQESAKVGGIGSCGRELCCSTWLTDFRSVNTNAARYQQLSINPQKLAGQCGKLKCCLNFELDSYLDTLHDFPPTNTSLNTEKGKAFCIKIDVFKRKMWFAYVENSMAWYDLDIDDVKEMIRQNKKGQPCPALEDMRRTDNDAPKSIDLIQENNVDRFEKNRDRNRNKKPNSNNRNRPKNQQNNKPREEGDKPKAVENNNKNDTKPQEGGAKKPNNKKFKRRPPKNNQQND